MYPYMLYTYSCVIQGWLGQLMGMVRNRIEYFVIDHR